MRPHHEAGGPKELPFQGKRFVITGMSSGIGKALAIEAAHAGAAVVGIDKNPSQFSYEDIVWGNLDHRAISRIGFVLEDVTNPHWLGHIAKDMQRKKLAIDYLVVAAGITQSKTGRVSEEEAEHILDVNLGGAMNTFDSFRDQLSPHATVIFLSSDMATEDNPPLPAYAESKKEIALYATRVANENPDLRVVTLLPGPVRTPLFRRNKTQDQIEAIDTHIGIMEPRDLARTLLNSVLPDRITYPLNAYVRMYKRSTEVVPQEVVLTVDDWKGIASKWYESIRESVYEARNTPAILRESIAKKFFEMQRNELDDPDSEWYGYVSRIWNMPDIVLDRMIAALNSLGHKTE